MTAAAPALSVVANGPELDISRRRVATARQLYSERRERDCEFGRLAQVFRDPAWDIALDLFIEDEEGRSVSASSAAIASQTPMTTGLRCIERMTDAEVVTRVDDPQDARRTLVSLTDEARRMMVSYLDRLCERRSSSF